LVLTDSYYTSGTFLNKGKYRGGCVAAGKNDKREKGEKRSEMLKNYFLKRL